MSLKNVVVLVISDKILTNESEDHVSKFILNQLNALNFMVQRITVIPEHENVISYELQQLVKYCGILILIGGVKNGVVYRALGKTTSQDLHCNADLLKIISDINTEVHKDEVHIPIQAKVLYCPGIYPVIYTQRIFILREEYLEDSFSKVLKNHLVQYQKEIIYRKSIQIQPNGNTSKVFKDLEKHKLATDHVQIELEKSGCGLILNISSNKLCHLKEFEDQLSGKMKLHHLDFVDNLDKNEEILSSNDLHIRNSIDNIEKCLDEFGPENVFVSFNGGKDCTVLLHLIKIVMKRKYSHYKRPIFCLYVQSNNPFPEQDEFIDECRYMYNLEIITMRSGIKEALQATLCKYPNYQACFMGTRRTDPFSSDLNIFQMTDTNWPQITRVSPLLDWHYSDIWDYLLYYKVPYCKLYDMGFTSLGNTLNTVKNPALTYYDIYEDKQMYLPAYKLLTETKERNGRNSS